MLPDTRYQFSAAFVPIMHNEHKKQTHFLLAQMELALARPNKKFVWQFFSRAGLISMHLLVGIYVLSI